MNLLGPGSRYYYVGLDIVFFYLHQECGPSLMGSLDPSWVNRAVLNLIFNPFTPLEQHIQGNIMVLFTASRLGGERQENELG